MSRVYMRRDWLSISPERNEPAPGNRRRLTSDSWRSNGGAEHPGALVARPLATAIVQIGQCRIDAGIPFAPTVPQVRLLRIAGSSRRFGNTERLAGRLKLDCTA